MRTPCGLYLARFKGNISKVGVAIDVLEGRKEECSLFDVLEGGSTRTARFAVWRAVIGLGGGGKRNLDVLAGSEPVT